MTTAPAAATSPASRTSKDLVTDILANMAAQGHATGDALDKLAAEAKAAGTSLGAAHRGATGPTAPAPATTTPPDGSPAPDPGLHSAERQITRPNGEVYFVRKMGIHDDVEVLREARRNQLPVLMFSGPGTGKTAMFEAAFTADGFYYVPGTGDTEVADFVGSYVPMPGGGFMWVDGPLPLAMSEGKPLLVDEVALIDARVMAVVYSVMDGRGELKITANPEHDVVIAEPGFYVAGACNPRAPGARMSEALLSRFALHIEVGIDYALMRKMGVPSKLVTCAQNIKKKYDSSEVGWFPAVREMLAFKKIHDVYGEDVALANMVTQAPDIDRPQVADIITRGYGRPIKGLEIR